MTGFLALAWKSARHSANAGCLLREQSPLKLVVILFFAIGLEAGLFFLFRGGFRFLDRFGGVGSLIVSRLFSVFFLGVGGMMAVSTLVTAYMTLYRSDETPFLLTRPVSVSAVAVYKFLEAAAFSSWAFFFIVVPFVAAFAWQMKLSPLFACWTLLFSVPFLLTCCGAGTVAVMLLTRWFPRLKLARAVALGSLAALCIAGWWMLRKVYLPADDAAFDLSRLVPGFRLASNAWLPSWWFSEGVIAVSRGQWERGAMLWLMLASTAAMLTAAVEWLGEATFYDTWLRVSGSQGSGRRAAVLFGRLEGAMGRLSPDVRAMVMKDVRIFFRDPMQWSQALVFFGLLALYFTNLRSFRYDLLPQHWRSVISFLNVFSVAAVLCSMGSRFVYPQLSLEGQGFWMLGLAPTSMRRILLTKFVVALLATESVSLALTSLSTTMLSATPAARVASLMLAAAISLAICALSCGLGAVFLDLRQRNPAAIVSGFGGTLNLVLTLAFMLLVILPYAVLFNLQAREAIGEPQLRMGLLAAGIWLVLVTAIATVLPLWIGVRSLDRRDY